VDEGYNEVQLLNGKEIEETYGQWLTVMDSVATGEAFIIVRNSSEQAIRLPPGALEIAIRPAVSLPRILTPSEVKKIEIPLERTTLAMAAVSEYEDAAAMEANSSSPCSFFQWNMNGLAVRVRKNDLAERFYSQIADETPDVISLQEVKLACEPGQPSKIKVGSEDEKYWDQFYEPLKEEYDAYLTLSSLKYGGQAVLVKKKLDNPIVSYNMQGKEGHFASGRFVKLEFPDMIIRSVYAPFNGQGKEHQLERRRAWDESITNEMIDSACTN
jgi:hypothetical protein